MYYFPRESVVLGDEFHLGNINDFEDRARVRSDRLRGDELELLRKISRRRKVPKSHVIPKAED